MLPKEMIATPPPLESSSLNWKSLLLALSLEPPPVIPLHLLVGLIFPICQVLLELDISSHHYLALI
jgi:hypothetical protein